MEERRIVFNTAKANDQGGIIPNDVIDFTRFNGNPVICLQHRWEDAPLGIMTDIKLIDGKWTGIPVFHRKTKESIEYADMYDGGFIKACSIGGFSEWKTNAAGQPVLDEAGNKICAYFDLYEISICTLPSNPEAVTLAAKFFEKEEIANVGRTITKLSTQFKTPSNVETKNEPTAEELKAAQDLEAAEKEVSRLKAEKEKVTASAGKASENPTELPGTMKQILQFGAELLGLAKKAQTLNDTGLPKGQTTDPNVVVLDPTKTETPEEIKLKAKSASKEAMEKAKEAASKALEAAKEAKEKADAEDATDEMKAAAKAAADKAKEAVEHASDLEDKYNAAADDDDDDDADENKAKKTKETNAAKKQEPVKTTLKTRAEMEAELITLTPKPNARVGAPNIGNLTMTKLQAAFNKDETSNEGKIMGRLHSAKPEDKNINDYATVLAAMMNDPKLKAVVEKVRFHQNIAQHNIPAMGRGTGVGGGLSVAHLASKLNNGFASVLGADNVLRQQTTLAGQKTTLNSTDNLLASPDLFAVEWLTLAIFTLFPSSDWKKDISVFGAQMTSENAGIIWANIAADPAIYKGAQPNNPATYTYGDNAVSLSLASYWLQPMGWTPNTMHQLRYDQQATGWHQAFAKWGTIMDDNLIYTLAASIPAGSILQTSGQTLNINPAVSGPNKFYYNPAFNGQLAGLAYNDIFTLEQLFKNQNFNLKTSKPTLVIDPIMDRYLKEDPDMKSLLTRWIKTDDGDILNISNTQILDRSRLAIYDPATGQVKDPNAGIPATSTSLSLGFIPDQVGIGLGMLDVFMTQNPQAYGYVMSADTRTGINALRQNYDGVAAVSFGTPNV